ncbi:cytochrome P450 [Streptomyces glaucosporus]|uniref:Cytochrome P450 n=1 Tax=Streptomyces glaucosporus TaxID=284044 RepID=A0ABN3HKC2_9ACTN
MSGPSPSPAPTAPPTGPFDELFAWGDRMRAAGETVVFDEAVGVWHVFGYEEAKHVVTAHETFSSEFPAPEEELSIFSTGNFALMDPPRHRKFRNLVGRAFTPRSVALLEPRVARLAEEILDEVPAGEVVDYMEVFASRLTTQVIAELLGMEPEHREKLRTWSDRLLSQNRTGLDVSPEVLAEIGRTAGEVDGFLRAEMRRRRETPGTDLISGLVGAEVDGERLSDEEIVGVVTLFVMGGHVTTTSLLTSAAQCLDEFPDVVGRLAADRSLLPSAIEEVVRYRPPFSRVVRRCAVDTELAGHRIPADAVVVVWLTSANFDGAVFASPERFDITRTPNPHLGYGHGVHFCLGAPLARMEARVALNALLDRGVRVTVQGDGAPREAYDPFGGILSLRSLPVVFEKGRTGGEA